MKPFILVSIALFFVIDLVLVLITYISRARNSQNVGAKIIKVEPNDEGAVYTLAYKYKNQDYTAQEQAKGRVRFREGTSLTISVFKNAPEKIYNSSLNRSFIKVLLALMGVLLVMAIVVAIVM